ncbi:MAG: transglycosylase domain-containing protein [Cyanobacteriota bacterium]|nr:transglycosylase domain-containing protein [Cyanobacteriota bacterium]
MSMSEKKSWIGTVRHLWQTWRQPSIQATAVLERPQPSLPQRLVHLRVIAPDSPPQIVLLEGQDIYVGRSRRIATILIPVNSVSHIHARIQERPPLGGKWVGRWAYLAPERWLGWLGWHRPRYVLVDQDSTNGVYRGKRQVKRAYLHHNLTLTLGPPNDPDSVKLQVIDPPPRSVYIGRGMGVVLAVLISLAFYGLMQEWNQISVDPLPAGTRGPLVLLAGDQKTPLRRHQADDYQSLPSLPDFGAILPKVVIASEDHRFYWHGGVDITGILRALWVNLRAGEVQQGGSSISQQLARTILRDYTGTENSLERKFREALAAVKLETHYSKDQILTLYLNNVYLGNGIYGFESAAQFYFGIPAKNLDLSQASTLVAVLPAPNAFNPVDNLDVALKGRDRVLDRLQELRIFAPEDIRRAKRSRLTLNPRLDDLGSTVAPYFYSAVISELTDLLGSDLTNAGNFIVETSLNLTLQKLAEQALVQTIEAEGSRSGFRQGALVTLDSRSGEVLALVGGANFQASQFNRVTQAQRQPGSTFKLFTYTAALQQGIPPFRLFDCTPLTWGNQTFNGCRRTNQPMSLAEGLTLSENVIALRIAQEIGLNRVIDMAELLGIHSRLSPYPSMVLGTIETNLLELTAAFGVIANQGVRTHPHTIRRILDSSDCYQENTLKVCREIYPLQEDPSQRLPVLSPEIANQMTQLLQNVVRSGTGQNAYLGLGEAGKTGTTTDNKDLLFVGFLPRMALVTGVWLGNDDATPTQGSSGQAAQVWGSYMRQAGQIR